MIDDVRLMVAIVIILTAITGIIALCIVVPTAAIFIGLVVFILLVIWAINAIIDEMH